MTDYDRAHLPTYLFLLDWSAGGGDWRKATEQLFSEEVATNHSRAKKAYEAHLARAKWMTQTGYRWLLDDSPETNVNAFSVADRRRWRSILIS